MAEELLPPLEQMETLRDRAYDSLRNAIIAGVLKPGERIKERDLARTLRISTTPVKEALRRLEQEGLVVKNASRGVSVSEASSASIEEICLIRAALHGIAARLAAQKVNEAELAELGALVEEMESATPDAPLEVQIDLNRRFHKVIMDASRNIFLPRFLATVTPFDRSIRMHLLTDKDRARQALVDHKQIFAALATRDPDRAEQTMRVHIIQSAESVLTRSRKAKR